MTLPEQSVAVPAPSLTQSPAWARPALRHWIIGVAVQIALLIPLVGKALLHGMLTQV